MTPNEEPYRLHTAARNGKCNLIKQYLAVGDSVDALDEKERTPLLVAVNAQQVPAARLLLSKGANPSACDENGLSPLFTAVHLHNIELASMLITAGADANATSTLCGISSTALYPAASGNDKKMVQLLIDAGCDVNKCFADGDPLLIETISNGHKEIVDMLIAAGADVNVRGCCSKLTALHIAAEDGYHALVVSLLKNGALIDVGDMDGHDALLRAVVNEFDEIVKLLLDAGANPHVKDIEHLATPLHAAASSGNYKCAYALLCAKADVNARDKNNYTPLLHASEAGHTEMVDLLLSAGADPSVSDRNDRTPLALASMRGHLKAVELLIDAGADPNRLDTFGRNAVFGVSSLDVLKLLLSRGGSAKVINIAGETTIHYAAHGGVDAGVICCLYKQGVDPTLIDKCGRTAADVAREKGHEDAAKMIDLLVAKLQSLA